MDNKKRTLRVYGTSGYNYKETPTIMLKGQWLKEFGFEPRQYFEIQCEDGKLVLLIRSFEYFERTTFISPQMLMRTFRVFKMLTSNYSGRRLEDSENTAGD